jgi:hypothetical protein
MLSKLFYGISSIKELSFLTIDVTNVRETTSSAHKSRIIGEEITLGYG